MVEAKTNVGFIPNNEADDADILVGEPARQTLIDASPTTEI